MSNFQKNNYQTAELIFIKMLLLFDIDRIKFLSFKDNCIEAIIGWPNQGQLYYDENEEQQLVRWKYEVNRINLGTSMVLEFLLVEKIVDLDLIKMSKSDLLSKICSRYNWNISYAENALADTLEINIERIDDGEKTDSFYLHF